MKRTPWILPLLLLIAGCSDDDPATPPSGPGSISGTVTELTSGDPLDGVTLLLVDAASLAAVRAPITPDATGAYGFTAIEPGTYSILLYHDSHVVFDRAATHLAIEPGRDRTHDFRLVPSRLWGVQAWSIEGTVTDAETGAPIVGAQVADVLIGGAGIHLFALQAGVTLPEWGVTNESGFFSIGADRVLTEDAEELGIMPISISKSGYLPATLIGDGLTAIPVLQDGGGWDGPALPGPAEGDSVLTVAVELTPVSTVAPEFYGSLAGRVVHLGEPVAGVEIAATLQMVADPDTVETPSGEKVVVPDARATSDDDGYFTLNGLAPGTYDLVPGYRPGDGWCGLNSQLREGLFVVESGQATPVGELEIVRTIDIAAPLDGATVPGSMPLLQWESIPGALYYEVDLGVDGYLLDELVERIEVDSYQMQPAEAIPSGSCARWSVRAYGTYPTGVDTVRIGESAWTNTFCVE